MNIYKASFIGGLFSLLLVMVGCGGGGGGASSTPVTLKFRTYSSTARPFSQFSTINSIGFRVILPQGVTVATDSANSSLTAKGVLKLSGVFTSTFSNLTSSVFGRPLQGSYLPTGTGQNAITVNLTFNAVNPPLVFGVGEFLTVNCTAAPGANSAKSNFTLDDLIIGDYLGRDISIKGTGLYKFGLL